MDKLVRNILAELRAGNDLDAKALDRIVRERSAEEHDGRRVYAKKRILPYYLSKRAEHGALWKSWAVDEDLDERFVKTLQMKPRRTASGVATITVITKPWPCRNNCVYCPNDPRMPKSYLSNEPACQRAERNRFHPYLQVASRLRTLEQMGHDTDKIELIVLGGTWLDYPEAYRIWFTFELFKALNDSPESRMSALSNPDRIVAQGEPMRDIADLESQHAINEKAAHRVVGLVFETRPDTVSTDALRHLRHLGCTKVQLGVQSIRQKLLIANGRRESVDTIRNALKLTRLFGFKIHAHFMVNLLGATPDSDKADYRSFVTDPAFVPDEVKLYPCALVDDTALVRYYRIGGWKPYSEEQLIDVLSSNLLDTPPFMRISRMIRDISAGDILVGNRKTNLRQLVEMHVRGLGSPVHEIRYREIGTQDVEMGALSLDEVAYETDGTSERFLQWVTTDYRIAGFLRLSLPHGDAVAEYGDAIPIRGSEAMIREVHVYGFATKISRDGESAQHRGLGKALVMRACEIARQAGYARINVISAVGVRTYYRKLGFVDNGLYQTRDLTD
ncbi:MAG: tRNA uridine(34) 5-carboxymethylaminomethyl modification radical SAM/GNAT enzyme Elp3 [Eggerthellaceae bacterium]|nr:tRNA uridine(34) 5-carboxymethylaminomethyl modification radical SAM/GNAT enzyme Elp3 [Eggerthellaceae bacterium]